MPYTRFAAGARLTAAGLNNAFNYLPLVAIKTADDAAMANNTVLENDDHLFVSVEANATYAFKLDLLYITPAAADLKIAWTYPSGLTMAWGGVGQDAGEVMVVFGGQTETSVIALGGGASDELIRLTGTITVGATAGTLQLQKAQNTSNAGSTITKKGSSLVLLKV